MRCEQGALVARPRSSLRPHGSAAVRIAPFKEKAGDGLRCSRLPAVRRRVPLFSAAAVHRGLDLSGPVLRVLNRHWYVLGEEVSGFEAEFSSYVGTRYCVSVANGTDALELALRAVGVKQRDRVICAANAGFYASTACLAVGAQPVYVDVDSATLCLSPPAVAAALCHKPAAVVLTHLYGQLASVEAISEMCRERGIPLIEDCAQAHGAQRNLSQAGSFGDVGCFSFYPTKNLGALGDGGALVTNRGDLDQTLRSLRQYGWSRKYVVERSGGRNSRLDEMQAAILREKLPHLDRQNQERRSIAAKYNAAFAALPLQCPGSLEDDYVAHLYVVRSVRRDALRAYLAEAGITTDVHYPVPDYSQPQGPGGTALPATEAACRQVLSLPCFPGMDGQDVERVIDAVREFHAAGF